MNNKFDSMKPLANKLLHEDGTITTFNGTPVDLASAAEKYKLMSPLKNEMLNPDGTTSPLNFGGGGGGGGILNITSTGGSIIVSGGSTKNVEVKIDNNDKILSTTSNGIVSNLSMTYNPSTGLLSLIGKASQTISSVTLALASFLESAEIVINPEGQPEGTYLVMTFKTADGTETKTYINVNTLAEVYSAGNEAINISSDNKISLVVDSNSNLEVTSNGLGLKDGFQLLSNEDKAKLDTIEEGAQVNLLEGIKIGIQDLTIDTDKKITLPFADVTAGLAISDTEEGKISFVNGVGAVNGWDQVVFETDLENYYTKTEIDLKIGDYALKSEIPTKTSELINDSGFIDKNVTDLVNYYDKTTTDGLLDGKQDVGDYALKSEIPTKTSELINDSGFIDKNVTDLVNYYDKTTTDSLLDEKQDKISVGALRIVTNESASGTVTLDLKKGDLFILTLVGNVIINFSNPFAGTIKKIIIKQDSTGGRTVTWNSIVKWPDGTSTPVETAGNKKTLVSLLFESTTNALVETFNTNY